MLWVRWLFIFTPLPRAIFSAIHLLRVLCCKNMMAILGFTTFDLKEFASYLLKKTVNFVNVLTVRFLWVGLIS